DRVHRGVVKSLVHERFKRSGKNLRAPIRARHRWRGNGGHDQERNELRSLLGGCRPKWIMIVIALMRRVGTSRLFRPPKASFIQAMSVIHVSVHTLYASLLSLWALHDDFVVSSVTESSELHITQLPAATHIPLDYLLAGSGR